MMATKLLSATQVIATFFTLLAPQSSTTDAASINFDPSAPKLSCGSVGAVNKVGIPQLMNGISTLYGPATLLLKPIAPHANAVVDGTGRMCVLSSWTTSLVDKENGSGFYFPLGRSVDGGDYTRPPGKGSRLVDFECGTAANAGIDGQFSIGEYLCQVTLPMTSKTLGDGSVEELDLPYYLTFYQRTVSVRNELSRFLQRTTFGPTSEELDALEMAFSNIQAGNDANGTVTANYREAMDQLQTEYIESQMDPNTFSTGSFTSLRKFYRQRLNPRSFETHRIAESGPNPCEANSRWRKFAFTNYDVENSKSLVWGSQDYGGIVNSEEGHKVTVEKVVYLGDPTGMPSISSAPSLSFSPSVVPTTAVPTLSPSAGGSNSPSVSTQPTATNILGFGGFEGGDWGIYQAWPSSCTRSILKLNPNITFSTDPSVDPTSDPNYGLVVEGMQSMKVDGGRCFLFRQIGDNCLSSRVSQTVNAGDLLRISLKIRVFQPNTVFQVYTAHYHPNKVVKWRPPKDDSHIVSRTLIKNANEWTTIEAFHQVGPDWTYGDELFVPKLCNHYQLRFRTTNSVSGFIIDDVHIGKVDGGLLRSHDVSWGFLANPNFALNHKYWKYTPQSGAIGFDEELGQNVMIMRRGKVMRQMITDRSLPNKKYHFAFSIRLIDADYVDLIMILRMRFRNNDKRYGVCKAKICNLYERPFRGRIFKDGSVNYGKLGGGNGNGADPTQQGLKLGWYRVVAEKFNMFGNYTEWDGKADFIVFQIITKNLPAGAEIRIGQFEMLDDESMAPSMSIAPSTSPSTLVAQDVGYVIRYAGEVRTVIRHPFQIDKTGEVLPMDGSVNYTLCDADEMEGMKVPNDDHPGKLHFLIDGGCKPIRHGNPTVDLDPRFLDMSTLHTIDLSSQVISNDLVPINVDQTLEGDWLLQAPVQDEVCATFPSTYDNDYRGADPRNPDAIPNRFNPDKPVFAYLGPEEGFALYDPRLVLHENTLYYPLMDGGGASVLRSTIRAENGFVPRPYPGGGGNYFVFNDKNIALCTNEQPNFINRENCKLSYEPTACQKIKREEHMVDVQLVITFDDATLAKLYNATIPTDENGTAVMKDAHYIYAVKNLRYDSSNIVNDTIHLPCTMGKNPMSRWIPRPELTNDTCTNDLHEDSVSALKAALDTSNDENPFLRDIVLWNGIEEDGCNVVDNDAYGMLVLADDGCWENVHPDHLSIFDMTKYIKEHLNMPNATSSDFTKFADSGILEYPSSHDMIHFENIKSDPSLMTRVGARYGDKMIIDQFVDKVGLNADPSVLISIAGGVGDIMLNTQVNKNRGGGVLVCGSPNEVAPDPFLDDYFDVKHKDLFCQGCQDSYGDYYAQKHTVWFINMLQAEDQLCQRMSWALYELLNVGTTSNPDNTETNLYTYDVFTRHCFGNYFDILKEMAYSPKMGEQFSYVSSSSVRFHWDVWNRVNVQKIVYPDENFAREIMQLYTIGLHELEEDGSESRDDFGRVIQTYNQYDILTNARIWTGFEYTTRRGNVEEFYRANKSRMEPMRILIDQHDFFPKTAVGDGWIGDRFPLCVDLPKQHFLKLGAKYIFRGGSSMPSSQYNPESWEHNEAIKRFVLSQESSLYQKLCNPDANGDCSFSNTVELNENLPCFGKECRVDTLIVVQVAPGAFYEYIRKPCVNLAFYQGGKKVMTGFSGYVRNVGRQYTHSMCSHPKAAVAARACCGIVSPDRSEYNYKFEYHGEMVTSETNLAQCVADGGTVCDPISLMADDPLVNIRPKYNDIYPSQNTFFWTDAPCNQAVKVRNDGMIAIVHNPQKNLSVDDINVVYVDLYTSISYIKVPWERDEVTGEEVYPTPDNNCGNGNSPVGPCMITEDEQCYCSVSITENFAFDALPTRDEVLSTLHIGAFDPSSYTEEYSLIAYSSNVEVFAPSNSSTIGDISTIFRVTDEYGDVIHLKNMLSNILIGNQYPLRNPVHFIDLVKVEERDAEYEVDAFLKHLVRHPSAAPFISKKLIQYFGVSNPSPDYVKRVTAAFKTGSFISKGTAFGSGTYGDMGAVAAAINLDPDILPPVTDEDPVSGNVREPLLKLMNVMRSLSFQRRAHVKFRYGLIEGLENKIGQVTFEPPDQFSFFSTDYSPPGVFADTEMVTPESQLMSMSSVVGITNGFFSLFNYGLAFADGGFGPSGVARRPDAGDYSSSVGIISYQPFGEDISSKIDDLSTMLTAGRMSNGNKQVLINAYNYFSSAHGVDIAQRILLQLMTSLPEFHSSNTVYKTGSERTVSPQPEKSSEGYKAIVFINLSGGADSFNMLTPHSDNGCYLYNDYFQARGGANGIGLTMDEILPIDGSSQGIENCDTFGINAMLPAFKRIYDEGKGIFLANMGHLHKPVTKANWFTETRTDLFSHHTMKKESHQVDAFSEADGTGILGRMLDILQGYGHAVSAVAVNTRALMVEGFAATGRLPDVMSSAKTLRIFEREFLKGDNQELRDFLMGLHSETAENSGIYADKWSQTFIDIWNKTDSLVETLRNVDIPTKFSRSLDSDAISSQLKLVAEMISIRNERGKGINRDVFYVQMGGWDGHSNLADIMAAKLPSLNSAVHHFWAEMKAQGLQNQVTVVQGSEFGRTINANSNKGSDHAWGGNYFIFGGDVKGGRILGEYPRSFKENDPTNIGRGRLIPTRSWDSLWYGMAQWFGITEQDDLDRVLPNSQNFGCDLFTDTDLFTSGTNSVFGCGGVAQTHDMDAFAVAEPRLLTGEEQKDICRLAVKAASKHLKFDRKNSRCFISNQRVERSKQYEGLYEVYTEAVLNFDKSIPAQKLDKKKVKGIAKVATTTAADFIVKGAKAQSASPSSMPSEAPSFFPSLSSAPSISSVPTTKPSLSTMPSAAPSSSVGPTVAKTLSPSMSLSPTQSIYPTASPITVLSGFTGGSVGFIGEDVGYVGIEGSSTLSNEGVWTVIGSGSDIWNRDDSFHYLQMPTSGDFTFSIFLHSLSKPHEWSKGGIMVRESLDQSSPHYSFLGTGNNGLANQFRLCFDCVSLHKKDLNVESTGVWLRVNKSGNVFRAFYKNLDSSEWNPFGEVATIDFSLSEFYLGVAVTAHTNSAVATLEASRFELTRDCDSSFITAQQCITSSNCEWSWTEAQCFNKGENPDSEIGQLVSSVVDAGSEVTPIACASFISKAVDGTTDKYYCDRTGLLDRVTGIVVTPSHKRLSQVKGIRIYTANNSPDLDPADFVIMGQSSTSGGWKEISRGEFPMETARNSLGATISSSPFSGDNSLNYIEATFDNTMAYWEYKVRFSNVIGGENETALQFAEMELPGVLLDTLDEAETVTSLDIGSPSLAGGEVWNSPGSWTVSGSGSDIYDVSDSFHFLYFSYQKDTDVTAILFVEGFEHTHQYSKGGLMIRSSLASDSPHASILVGGSSMEVFWQHRVGTGDTSWTTPHENRPVLDYHRIWLRLEKVGYDVRAYHKCETCTTWELLRSATMDFLESDDNFYIGIPVTSHTETSIAHFEVSNFEIVENEGNPVTTTSCISWRQTGACSATGPLEPHYDQPCDVDIPPEWSGFCECVDGTHGFNCGHEIITCNEVCSNGEMIIDQTPRCGISEVDSREHCNPTCNSNADCPEGQLCWGVYENLCGSIPQRVYTDPVQSSVATRCGKDEITARTFCGSPCTGDSMCPEGETCIAVNANYCDSEYSEVQ